VPGRCGNVLIRFKDALIRSLPVMADQELTWRIHFMFGALSCDVAGNDPLEMIATCVLDGVDDARAAKPRLIPFLAARLRAPLTTLQAKRAQVGRG
jgi:hypothetical protein